MIKIRPEFYVNLKGKQYPTWPGVLVALHDNGLLGIEVQALQHPTEENGYTAICQATVTMKGDEGRELIFTEVGDASPKNCSPQIALAALRMAATRAKGRAGRDALALGETLAEEMPEGVEAPQNGRGHQHAPEPRPAAQRARHDPEDTAARKAAQEPAAVAMCAICGEPVDERTAEVSRRKFAGEVLCVSDGKARLAGEREPSAVLQGA